MENPESEIDRKNGWREMLIIFLFLYSVSGQCVMPLVA